MERDGTRRSGAVAAAAGSAVAGIILVVLGVGGLVSSVGDILPSSSTVPPTSSSVAAAVSSTTGAVTTTPSVAPWSGETVAIFDDSGAVSVVVPAEWGDVSRSEWVRDGEVIGLALAAAVDRAAWVEGWGTPGVFVGVVPSGPDAAEVTLGDWGGSCSFGDVRDEVHDGYTMLVQVWTECGVERSVFTTALVWPADGRATVLIQLVTLDGSGDALLELVSGSFTFS